MPSFSESPLMYLLISLVYTHVSRRYGAFLLEVGTADCPSLLRGNLDRFLMGGVVAAACSVILFFMSFAYAQWYEPIGVLFLSVFLLGPLAVMVVANLGHGVFFTSYVVSVLTAIGALLFAF